MKWLGGATRRGVVTPSVDTGRRRYWLGRDGHPAGVGEFERQTSEFVADVEAVAMFTAAQGLALVYHHHGGAAVEAQRCMRRGDLDRVLALYQKHGLLALMVPVLVGAQGRRRSASPSPSPQPTAKSFSADLKEAYLTDDGIAYVRPGLKIKVNSITIGSDRKPATHAT